MLPHLGAGAGQGMEDAYLIAKLLGRLNSESSDQDIEVSHLTERKYRMLNPL